MKQLVYNNLLLIITLRFTCGERKICSAIKKSQNVINMIVDYTFTSARLTATILGRLVSLGEGPPSTNSRDALITWSVHQVRNKKRCIFTSKRPMATTLGRVVAFGEKMLSTNSHNSLMTWTHQVIWQIKNVIYQLVQGHVY